MSRPKRVFDTDYERNTDTWISGIVKNYVSPAKKMSVSEWSDAKRVMSSKVSADPGPWRTSKTPYLKEIMDCLSTESKYERVVVAKAAQLGLTEAAINWCGYIIDQSPAPLMVVWPTDQMVKDNVKIRLNPMIDNCPSVRKKIGMVSDISDGSNTMLMKEFPGGQISIASATSSSDLKSKACRFLILDEVDEYPVDLNGQGDPCDLAITRTNSYDRKKKIFMASTPRLSGESRIFAAYEETDMRKFYVPCPFCGEYQVLQFDNLKCNPGQPLSAWYECPFCRGAIMNHHKTEMLSKGEWRASVKDYNGKYAGFWISSLYSPVGMMSWGDIMTKYLHVKNNVVRYKEFVNTILGEPFKDEGDTPDWERLYNRREKYPIGSIPKGVLMLTAGVDVQKDRIEACVDGWGRDKERWSIEYHVFSGNTSNIKDMCWSQLSLLLEKTYENSYGNIMNICQMCVDAGYNTQIVYDWCRTHRNKAFAAKGIDSMRAISQPKVVDLYKDNVRKKRALEMYDIGVSLLKSELYGYLDLPEPELGEIPPPGYIHFPDYDMEFFKQLCAEERVQKENKNTKVITYEWKKLRERNEALDTMIYSRAAASKMQIDRLNTNDWDRIENAINPDAERVNRVTLEGTMRINTESRSSPSYIDE